MARGRHKRKREQQHRAAEQRALEISANERQVSVETAMNGTSSNDRTAAVVGLARWHWFTQWLRRPSLTDWLLMIFTGALVWVGITQGKVLSGQLEDMRKDQRPWLEMTYTVGLEPNGAVGGFASIVNHGKTPARAIDAHIVVEKIENGQQPKLDYPIPHTEFTTGLIFPNQAPVTSNISRKKLNAEGKDAIDDVLTPEENQEFQDGKIFFVVYGKVTYSDFFNVRHWTQSCEFVAPRNHAYFYSAEKCTDYGDIDTN